MCTTQYRDHSYDTESAEKKSVCRHLVQYQGERSGANWVNYFVLFVKYYPDNNSNRNQIEAT